MFIDNCDFWAEQIYAMIEGMLRCAASLTVCVRADPDRNCRDRRVFLGEYRAHARLTEMAAAQGCALSQVTLPVEDAPWEGERYTNPALSHLARELFAQPFRPYTGDAQGITLFAATDRAAEAEAAAEAVQRAARAGLRYREMALVACDLPAYAQLVQRALKRRGIPCFTDAKHPLCSYALARLLQAALRAASEGFGAQALFEIGKTGLAGVDLSDMEEFENHVRRYGLKGRALEAPFTRGEVPAAAERCRAALMEPLLALREGLREGKRAREKVEALYAYMEALHVRESIEEQLARLRAEGRHGLLEENRQVYDTFMELFSQLHALVGDAPLSTRAFCAMFEEGVAAYEIGAIPATADQLLFGSIDRTRARGVKALFLLGAQEGALPRSVHDDGLIDDEELARLAALGLRTWDDAAMHAATARMDAYMVLTTPAERLYISCHSEGEALPSSLLERIGAVFPGLRVESALAAQADADAEAGFMRLARSLRAYVDGEGEADAALYAWFAGQKAYAARLSMLERAVFAACSAAALGPSRARALYGKEASASRLESFNACPFRHFARYGLGLEARREYGLSRADEGSFAHAALALFTDALIKSNKAPAAMGEADVDALLGEILEPLLAAHNGGILTEGARMRARGARLARRVRETALAITRQLGAGSFMPAGSELAFGRGGRLPALRLRIGDADYALRGKIDRLDSFQSGGRRYLRVVDYKSGGEDFDFAELYHGLKLQLPLYMAAAAETAGAVAAGLYYMPVDDPAFDEGEDVEKAFAKRFRMRGVSLDDPLVAAATDSRGYGVLSAREQRASAAEMARLLAYAKDKSRATAARILAGEIEARPVLQRKNNRSACERCPYGSLCGFDRRIPGYAYRQIGRMDKEAFMEKSGDGADKPTE